MLNSEFREPKCNGLRNWTFWFKLFEMVLPAIVCPMFALFDETATVHIQNTQLYYNISLVFPYKFVENITVVSPPNIELPTLTFAPTLLPSAILFVVVVGVACIVAIVISFCYVTHRGTPKGEELLIWYFFVALAVIFVLLASICFWMANLVRLKNDVDEKIASVFAKCAKASVKCQEYLPTYITLYIATALSMLLTILWICDAIRTYITVAHTIPQEITRTTLAQNIELPTSEYDSPGTTAS